MGIFSRYVFRQGSGAMLMILLSLTGIVWIATALKQLNLVTGQGQDAWMFLRMTFLALPNLMALIAPIALLIAVMHTLNRLNGDSELIVLTAAGAPTWFVLKPLLSLAAIVSLALFIAHHLVMPWSLRLLRETIIQIRTDLISQVVQPGAFTAVESDLTFHIRDRGYPSGELFGILMHDGRDKKQRMSYLAERGQLVKEGKGAYLVMLDGHIIRRSDEAAAPQIIVFKRYAVDLARFEQKDDTFQLKPRERYLAELLNPNRSEPSYRYMKGQYRSELHERFASPLYPFAFVMIVVAFVGQAQTTRQNRVQMVVLGFLAAAGCRLLGLAATNLVTLRAGAVPLMYAVPLGAILISSVVIQLRMQPGLLRLRLPRRRATTVADAFRSHPGGPAMRGPKT
ncbi:MAG: LPS export ABC transporter permease LptF [Hyphomicrobiaceae bacterium]|nr:LPS export ABC transporter permease LptF [Hyphomicrobiaceae bacterium]